MQRRRCTLMYSEPTRCCVFSECARLRYEQSVAGRLGPSVVCNELGNFERHQCTGSQCHCVDGVTGQRLPGTEVRDEPQQTGTYAGQLSSPLNQM